MNEREARFTRRERQSQGVLPILMVVLLVFLIQLWLLTIALEESLAGGFALATPTFLASGVCFAFCLWLLRYVRSHTFEGFGWYRIALGGAVLAAAMLH